MLPVVTPLEMGAIDASATEPLDVLIDRAGSAVARAALDLLGGSYGRRVLVVAGKGNNGADGRSAAVRLRRRGVRVEVVDVATLGPRARLPEVDLVIDAAYGTGFRGNYDAPDPGTAAVLAVDIPSGIEGLTGVASGHVMRADATITFAAFKPGLLLGDGPAHAGEVEVADIGLDVSRATIEVIEPRDVTSMVPSRSSDDHKWRAACLVVGGSPGMGGAPHLSAAAAQRGGAGMVLVATPGAEAPASLPLEAVAIDGRSSDWVATMLASASRAHSVVVGPGLDPAALDVEGLVRLVDGLGAAAVVDGGAIDALAARPDALAGRPVVLTPHDGEFARLTGAAPGDDRVAVVRSAAERSGVVVLLKGATTVIARPDGAVRLMADGDERLATAGSGDVLAGLIGAYLARGAEPFDAAAAAAEVHALAAGATGGVIASDLIAAISQLER